MCDGIVVGLMGEVYGVLECGPAVFAGLWVGSCGCVKTLLCVAVYSTYRIIFAAVYAQGLIRI